MQRFLNNIELWLSGAGLIVVWAASMIAAPGGADLWQIAAVTALAVSVLHGGIFWVVRRRQRRVRREAIVEIKEMLGDVVKNQLAVIDLWVQMGQTGDDAPNQLEGIRSSIDEITEHVDGLSEESLTTWKRHYREAVANATELQAA